MVKWGLFREVIQTLSEKNDEEYKKAACSVAVTYRSDGRGYDNDRPQ